jgi:hypothetical protein
MKLANPKLGRRALMLAATISTFAAVDRAEAACDPASPVSGTIVTCTGTTTDQNGTTGYGTSSDTGNTINVESGASVSGKFDGLAFGQGTVNNFGSIISREGFFGVFVTTTPSSIILAPSRRMARTATASGRSPPMSPTPARSPGTVRMAPLSMPAKVVVTSRIPACSQQQVRAGGPSTLSGS